MLHTMMAEIYAARQHDTCTWRPHLHGKQIYRHFPSTWPTRRVAPNRLIGECGSTDGLDGLWREVFARPDGIASVTTSPICG